MNKSIWNKIKYWKRKYDNVNGWAVRYMVGWEYEERNKKYREKK